MIPTELLYVPIFILFQNLFRIICSGFSVPNFLFRFFCPGFLFRIFLFRILCSEFTLELYFDQITFGSGPALLFAAVTDPQEAFRHPHH